MLFRTIGGGDVRNPWPRNLPRHLRTMSLFGAVPGVVEISDRVARATHALQFLQIVDTIDSAALDVTRKIITQELSAAAAELQQRLDYMAELVRMTDATEG